MQLHLTNGQTRLTPIGAPTMGASVTGITLYYDDLCRLLDMPSEVLKEYLGVLSTRYALSATNMNFTGATNGNQT